jgi:type II secretory pathway pseudopilin PulG
MELLVTMAVIAALASLALPAWGVLSRSGAQRKATAVVMESLERARTEAITTKQEVWVLFRHHPRSDQPDSLRLLGKKDGSTSPLPLGPWIKLPPSITFRTGAGTLMDERPPADILQAGFQENAKAGDCVLGGLMFRRAGGIGIPVQGGNTLSIILGAPKGGDSTITLARAAGRATTESP